MVFYVENLVESPKMILKLISEFNKVAVYKINTQKSVIFL